MNSKTSSNIIVTLWRSFWGIVSWLRTSLLNLIFLAVLFIVISAMLENMPEPIDREGPLFISPSGVLVDQLSYQAPLSALSQQNKAPETLLRELIDTIEVAATDDRITGLIIKLDDLGGGGISKIQELGQAIDYFKSQNKPVTAYSNSFNQQQYLLATYADTIYMHDMGHVALTGFALYRNYFRGLIEKLGVNVHVFKSGTFKDFVEPYVLDHMSDHSRQHNEEWLTTLWQHYSSHIESRRNLTPGSLGENINNLTALIQNQQGDTAQLAVSLKLIDHVGSKQTLINQLKEKFGASEDDKKPFNYIDFGQYQQELAMLQPQTQANIGLIVAAGSIMDGEQHEGSIGGDTLARQIRQARNDKELKALVIRVDSGGGSAFASEIIRQEIAETRAAGKPVYISMGSMAASGGYWLATAADQIFATPTTLTGSIGVFSIIPTFESSLSKVGVTSDGLATHELAGLYHLDRPMSASAEQIFQVSVESIYHKFLTLTATARNTDVEQIKAVAEGRVWLGQKAQTLNLVDQIGSLNDTIKALAAAANIDNPEVRLIERELSPMEQMLKSLMDNAAVNGSLGLLGNALGEPFTLFQSIQHNLDHNPLWAITQDQLNTPTQQKVYAACLDCGEF